MLSKKSPMQSIVPLKFFVSLIKSLLITRLEHCFNALSVEDIVIWPNSWKSSTNLENLFLECSSFIDEIWVGDKKRKTHNHSKFKWVYFHLFNKMNPKHSCCLLKFSFLYYFCCQLSQNSLITKTNIKWFNGVDMQLNFLSRH